MELTTYVYSFQELKNLDNKRTNISIHYDMSDKEFQYILNNKTPKYLKIYAYNTIKSLKGIKNNTTLQHLEIDGDNVIYTLEGIENNTALQYLEIGGDYEQL